MTGPGSDEAPGYDVDPEVTDAFVEEQVGQHRWFWLLLLKDGPLEGFEPEAVAAIQAAHLRHMFTLRRRGLLRLFGPVRDASPLRGIGILVVETREEAEALFAGDPWILAGGLIAEIRPFFTLPGAWQTG